MEHEYHFNVKMNCGACSNAIERVLSKLEGACFLRLTYTRCDVAGDKSGEANGHGAWHRIVRDCPRKDQEDW